MSLGDVGCMGGYLVCHHTLAHIVLVGQCKVLLGSDIAEHCRAIPSYHRSTDGTRDMVVGRGDVGDKRTECIEWCTVALLYLSVHICTYLLHGHMARSLDKCLHVLFPCPLNEFAHRVEFGKLCRVVGVVGRTGAQTVAKGYGNVIFCADVADVVKVLVEETLLLMHHAPLGYDTASTAHHTRQATLRQGHVLQANATVDGEVVNSLFALLDECVTEYLPCQVFCLAIHFLECLIHWHCAHGHRTVAQNPLSRLVDILSRREVHQGVAAPFAAPHCLLHLLVDTRVEVGVADVGVDLHEEIRTDNHRFCFGVIDVGGDYGTAGCHLLAHKLGSDMRVNTQLLAVHVFADCHIFHLLRDYPSLGESHLCLALLARVNPRLAQFGQTFFEVDFHLGVTVRTAGVIHIDGRILFHALLAILNSHGGGEVHSSHSHSQFGIYLSVHVDFLRTWIGDFDIVVHIV